MKTLKKISLRQLDKAELSKRQEGLLFGGGDPGVCRCGSCASDSGNPAPSTIANDEANYKYGYTISGSNPGNSSCKTKGSAYAVATTPPGW